MKLELIKCRTCSSTVKMRLNNKCSICGAFLNELKENVDTVINLPNISYKLIDNTKNLSSIYNIETSTKTNFPFGRIITILYSIIHILAQFYLWGTLYSHFFGDISILFQILLAIPIFLFLNSLSGILFLTAPIFIKFEELDYLAYTIVFSPLLFGLLVAFFEKHSMKHTHK